MDFCLGNTVGKDHADHAALFSYLRIAQANSYHFA